MQLHLVRHAESENNAKPVHARVCDPAITARGRLQADFLGKRLADLEIDELITSPFLRTLQTTRGVLAHRVASTKRFPVLVWHDVFESGGCYRGHQASNYAGAPGLNRTEIESFFTRLESPNTNGSQSPVRIDSQIGSQGWWGGRDRESESEMRARATRVIERFRRTYVSHDNSPEKPAEAVIVLVAHADFLLEMLSQLLPVDTTIGPIPNTSVTSIRWDSSGLKLTSLNSVPHLPPRLVTGNVSHAERSSLS